jgi:hypothetical protein
MKPKHIKKETAKRLREGFHTDLMNVFEEAVDLYGEDEFERGYQSFFGDASAHAERIAGLINFALAGKYAGEGNPHRAKSLLPLSIMERVIEEYFNSLKTELP